jgi:hypothetical protein
MEFFHALQSTLLTVAFVAALWLLLVVLRGRLRRDDPLWAIFVIALIVRIPLAIGVYHVLPHGWLDKDWQTYEAAARTAAQTGELDPILNAGYAFRVHALTNTAVYWLIGFQPVFLRIMSAAMGAFTCALLYLLLERLIHRPRAAIAGALIATFWPTFIAWSTTNSKETFIGAVAIGMFYCALSLSRRFRPSVAVIMLALAAVLIVYRIYFSVLIFPIALVYVLVIWTRAAENRPFALFTALIMLGALGMPVLVMARNVIFRYFNPENLLMAINIFRSAVARGGAQLPIEPFGSFADLLLHIPVGISWYFLRPYPWDLGNLNQTLGAMMMIVFYPLLIMTVMSIPRLWRSDRAFTAYIIVQTLVLAAAYGVLEGNMGSMMRHRLPTTILILGIGGAYLAMRIAQRSPQSDTTDGSSAGESTERGGLNPDKESTEPAT